ncbi:MAG: 16S rRNA (cytosine(967)-C(5))-methyltransferase RsmB [Planctomycetes bacterium]|nr:16S rRNA (cytosine(967)-C(5))-methyltransferase RsmB [Planctomycetota bacterium]
MNQKPHRSAGKKNIDLTQTPGNARELAFVVLDEHQRSGKFAAVLLDARLREGRFSGEDRRLATEIVYGIVRRQATLDALIEPHLQRPRHKIEDALWTFMQMGVYQLVFLTSVPAHAAVYETVETAKRLGKLRWRGFLNGILRAVERNLTDLFSDHAAADAIPITAGRYRQCSHPIFPNPETDPGAYFAKAFSFPDWLSQRWLKRLSRDELTRIGFWFNTPAKIWLRVNVLKTTREKLLVALEEAGITAVAGNLPEAVRLEDSARIEQLPGFSEGWFSVQDYSAMQAARLLSPQPGQFVLDLCAAPGTKTTHLAELMQNQGTILATDVNAERLGRIEENVRRLGLEIIQTQKISEDGEDIPNGPFDAVLVDVPCSNTGVLGKRPEARWRLRPEDFKELPALQKRLLEAACKRLKSGGRLVYSTCSIEPEENNEVVRSILESCPEIQLLEEIEHVPGKPADGGYQALLCRRE